MLPLQSDLEKTIQDLKEKVEIEERRGNFNSAHHAMLKQNMDLLKPKELPKFKQPKGVENGE